MRETRTSGLKRAEEVASLPLRYSTGRILAPLLSASSVLSAVNPFRIFRLLCAPFVLFVPLW